MRAVKMIAWLVFAFGLGVFVLSSEAVSSAVTSAATAYPPPGTPTATPRSGVTPSPGQVRLYFPYVSRSPGPVPAAPQVSIVSGDAYTLVWQRTDGLQGSSTQPPAVMAYTVYERHADASGTTERQIATLPSRLANETFAVLISAPETGVNTYTVVARNTVAAQPSNEVTLPAPARFDSQVVDGHGGRFTLRWSPVVGAGAYALEQATSPSSAAVTRSWSLDKSTLQYEVEPQPLGAAWFRVTAKAADASVHSEWMSVQSPRPGLWGRVTYKGTPRSNVTVDLMRCTVNSSDPRYCVNDVQVDELTTLADGSYNFTGVPPTQDPSDPSKQYQLYIEFTNDDDPSYLLEWIGEFRRWPQDMGPNGTAEASSFDIANIPLVSPAPFALQPLPVTFVWQRRGLSGDSYGVRFTGPDLATPLYTRALGDVDSFGPLIDVRPLRMDTQYLWQAWVNVDKQGHGRSYYARPITFVPRPPSLGKDASLESLKSLLSPTTPPFSSRPAHIEPLIP